MTEANGFSLLTFVLQPAHCTILRDWMGFFDQPPDRLVVHVGQDPAIAKDLTDLAGAFGAELVIAGQTNPAETTENETGLLWQQFDLIGDDLACIVRLDTLPYRQSNLPWQAEAMEAMAQHDALFLTGSTLPFRADTPLPGTDLMRTQRFSNCFAILPANVWREAQRAQQSDADTFGRFGSEAAVELYCSETGAFGLRLINRPELRVFHCQEWGPRMELVRAAFQAGRGIAPFLKGYQDDFMGARARFYMEKRPPLHRRARILLGRWKRSLLGRAG
ncbi:hypothetical protein KBY31_12395 [Ruegeria pomeroyi]|nr:hypothetical protein [Ruegeria pomeroyi]